MIDVHSPQTAKKPKIEKKINYLPNLLNKDADYLDLIKFDKLLSAADAKELLTKL